jgi:hypothetical protein
MNADKIKNSIAYCGLICPLCSQDGSCDCKLSNQCGKKSSPEGCFQYKCCVERGYAGCWECPEAPCGKDMFQLNATNRTSSRRKLRAFIACIKEDGIEKFSEYIFNNLENGIVYHRNGVYGDYDLDTEEEILRLVRTGKQGEK